MRGETGVFRWLSEVPPPSILKETPLARWYAYAEAQQMQDALDRIARTFNDGREYKVKYRRHRNEDAGTVKSELLLTLAVSELERAAPGEAVGLPFKGNSIYTEAGARQIRLEWDEMFYRVRS